MKTAKQSLAAPERRYIKSVEFQSAARVFSQPQMGCSIDRAANPFTAKVAVRSIEYWPHEGVFITTTSRNTLVPMANIKDLEFFTDAEADAFHAKLQAAQSQAEAV